MSETSQHNPVTQMHVFVSQAADCHKHAMLDRIAFEWSTAVVGQSSDPDGFPVCTLLQYVVNSQGTPTTPQNSPLQRSLNFKLVIPFMKNMETPQNDFSVTYFIVFVAQFHIPLLTYTHTLTEMHLHCDTHIQTFQ